MNGKRVPITEREAYAWGFLAGYAPDSLARQFPDTVLDIVPDFIETSLAVSYRLGYDTGVATYSDHNDERGE